MRTSFISALTETVSGSANRVAKTMLGGLVFGFVLASILPSFDEDADDATFFLLFVSQGGLSIGLPVVGAGLGGLWYGGRALVNNTLWSRSPPSSDDEGDDVERNNITRPQ